MNESELIKLKKKVEELKQIYNLIKKRRENISLDIASLDGQLDEYDKELKKIEKEIKHKKKGHQELNIKSSIKKTIFIFGTCLLTNSIISIFIKDIKPTAEINTLTLVLPALGASIGINLLPNILLNRHYQKENKKIAKQYIELKEERKNCVSKRLTLGYKYKDMWESEMIAKKAYKDAEKRLTLLLAHSYNESEEYKKIDTRDIYQKIKVDETYYQETTESKILIIDKLLKDYLQEKLIESNLNKVNIFINDLTTEDLFTMLLERVPKNEHHEVLSNIIHAILGIYGNIQNYGIVWYEENDEKLITNPEVIFDENDKWTELKTHKNTPYDSIFKIIYNTFKNTITKKDEYKRTKKKQ